MGCGSSRPDVQGSGIPGSSSSKKGSSFGSAASGKGRSTPRNSKGSTSSDRGQTRRSLDRKSAANTSKNLGLVVKHSAPGIIFPEGADAPPPPEEFTFEQIQEITDGFSSDRLLGEGGFGKVYRGEVVNEAGETRQLAIKKLNEDGMQGFNEWLTEVIFLRRLQHPHLVPLVGYCSDDDHGLLVYELMAGGSLDKHLFPKSRDAPVLTWEQRVKAALGAAKGLAYLHHGTEHQVLFRDLKAANILLDGDFNAKLSDFGLARDGPEGNRTHVSTQVVGTQGYTAPEYIQTGHVSASSDVYAFGVVLLELLTGRLAQDDRRPLGERSLVSWARPFLEDRNKLLEIMDPRLGTNYPRKAARKLAVVAECCLRYVKARPTSTQLVQVLTKVQEAGLSNEPSKENGAPEEGVKGELAEDDEAEADK